MSKIQEAEDALKAHLLEIIDWHFDPASGCRHWLDWAKETGKDPRKLVKGPSDLFDVFGAFEGDVLLRTKGHKDWHPRGYAGVKRWSMFMTGGTSGDPKLRWGRLGMGPDESDYGWDYTTFSEYLPPEGFPSNGVCLFMGPQGPRRLRLGVEILAMLRSCGMTTIDCDVAWLKNPGNPAEEAYLNEILDRCIAALNRHEPDWVFVTPVLIERIAARGFDWSKSSVKGAFVGGTEMRPEEARAIIERYFKRKIIFVPTYGNALVGLARPRRVATFDSPIAGQDPYSIIYQSLRPRTFLQVVKPLKPGEPIKELLPVRFGERGQVVITTLTKEFFMPLYPERDEAGWIEPTEEYPWPGLKEVGPPPGLRGKFKKGMY